MNKWAESTKETILVNNPRIKSIPKLSSNKELIVTIVPADNPVAKAKLGTNPVHVSLFVNC